MAEAPQKDVVYIDVEDDITAIIGKLKSSKHYIVALVPPKRTGVLQSAVNLRLLARSAEQHDKRLVIITGNSALVSLAAAAKIPVAKNLQSKPELGEIAALDIDNGEEIIDGAQLPIGEHAKQAGDDSDVEAALGAAAVEQASDTPRTRGGKKKSKVPNFNSFRKKLFLFGALGAFLIGFLVWAIWFAPHATVILSTRTTSANVSQQVTLGTKVKTDAAKSTIAAEVKTSTEKITISFDATGEKTVGDKATGTVTFTTSSPAGASVAAGTTLTSSSGFTYTVNSAVSIPAATLSFGCGGICPGETTGGVTATDPGSDYNGDTGSLSGVGAGVGAEFVNPTSGGTDKVVPAVTQKDLDAAKASINDEINKDAARSALAKEFDDSYVVITDSFAADTSAISSSAKVGDEAPNGKATLEGDAKYTLYAVSRAELNNYLDTVIAQQIDNADEQKVYNNGIDTAAFGGVASVSDGVTASLTANGTIGPKIDEDQVRSIAAGKNYGEIQEALVAITGVDAADTQFSPFWVSRAPNDTNKISVEFNLDEQ